MPIFPEQFLTADPVGAARNAPVDPLLMPAPADTPITAPALADLPPAPTPPWPVNYNDPYRRIEQTGRGPNPYEF